MLDLSEGRLVWRKGPLRPSELRALQPVDDSETGDEKPNLLTRIGLYLSESPVGRQLFKPEIFHLWPSPAAHIAGSLGDGGFHLNLFQAPASCVEDCSKTWVTTTRLIYAQDGYCPQHLWKGVLELTTPSDWRREPKGVRLTLHLKGHNLDYAIGKRSAGYGGYRGLHLRNVLAVLSLPRRLLGVSTRRAWSTRLLCETPPMPIRAESESQLQRYCLDRWREVAVDRLPWVYQDGASHDFARMALQDANFPWSGSFGDIYAYMCKSRASSGVISSFERTWEAAGLATMAFCLDCKVFVDKAELLDWRHDEEEEEGDEEEEEEEEEEEKEEKEGRERRPHVRTCGCWVVECSPGAILGYGFFDEAEPRTLGDVYGKGAGALFGRDFMDEPAPHRRDRRTAVWQYHTDTNSWQLHRKERRHRQEEEAPVRWRKTCGGVTTVSEHRHFPRRHENSYAANPDP